MKLAIFWLVFFTVAVPAQDFRSDSLQAAGAELDLYKTLYSKGDYSAARDHAERALGIYQRLKGPGDTFVPRALQSVALSLLAGGDYRAAGPYFEQALSLSRTIAGPEDRETVGIMERFAINLTRSGDYAKAKVMQEEALAISERRFGPDDPLTGDALSGLGQLLQEMGDYASALQFDRRALAIMERRAGKDSLEVANSLITIGNNAREAADYLASKAYFERAAAIYETQLGAENTRTGGALDNLGQTLMAMKRFAEARSVLERALAIQTKSLGPRHPWTANVIQGLARLEVGLGNYSKAREFYLQNLDIWREVLGPEHPFTLVSMSEYSAVLAHLGEFPEALATALKAAEIRRDNIVRTVATVDERQALRYAAAHNTSMDIALSIASRPAAPVEDSAATWDALIRSRALVLDEMSARHRSIRDSADPQIGSLEDRVAAARNRITKLVLQGPGKLSLADYNEQLEAARREWESTGTDLAVKSASFRQDWAQQRTGLSEIKAALPVGSALVAFRRYRPTDSSADSYLAFVLAGPKSEALIVRLGSAPQIDALVAKWRAEIDRERGSLGRSAKANEAQYRASATALRQAIWDPIQRHLGSAARVYIVPDGALQLVNFAALPAATGGYLVESGPLLHVLSTERDLAAPAPTRSSTELLVVADPQYQARIGAPATPHTATYRGAPSTCADLANMQFESLPGSLAEAQAITRIWNNQHWHGLTLSGTAATEESLKQNAAGKRVVHIATHGFFLDAQCPGSAVARENPLLRAGLAFAGANHRQSATPDEDDGVLTAEEASALPLENTEWVVLSGCDTGAGDVTGAEGLMGLRRAFQEAGAHTLITSLWPVDDKAASQWMETLYRARFYYGKSTAGAVRDADLNQLRALRKSGASTHPYYWAGFLAVGDWR